MLTLEETRMTRKTCVAAAAAGLSALLLAAADARAQAAAPGALARAVISGAAAERAGTRAQINGVTARAIVDACLAYAKANNASYAIYVLGPGGEMVQTHVMDGQLPIGVETALVKARTALYARMPTREVAERYAGNLQSYMQRSHLGESSGLAYYPVAGGLPIVVEGFMIGAIGVGGGHSTVPGGRSPSDEQCAQHALTTVLGSQAAPPPQAAAPVAPAAGAVPLANVVVSGRAAARIATRTQINAATARAIVDECVGLATRVGAAYSIFLLAPSGEILESYIMDGQQPINSETALMKAKTALYTRAPTREVMARFADDPLANLYRLDLGQSRGLWYFANAGGLPIVVEGQLIGAIGVGGMPPNGPLPSDEACAHQALTKVLGPQPPLPARPAPAAR
jgi:uncharacterized protein GlcG (DUF336 family)